MTQEVENDVEIVMKYDKYFAVQWMETITETNARYLWGQVNSYRWHDDTTRTETRNEKTRNCHQLVTKKKYTIN